MVSRVVQNRCDVIKFIVFCARAGHPHGAAKNLQIQPFPLVSCEVLTGAFTQIDFVFLLVSPIWHPSSRQT